MKIEGKITACSAGEKGISIKIDIENFTDKSKEDAEQLLRWAVYNSALKIQLSEDTTQKKLDEES